jgi:uncharacterized protein (TIGR02266 family)
MKIVFPVRFAQHHGAAVQTTSREMTDKGMMLLCPQRRPPSAALVALQLHLPDAQPPAAAMGRVREAGGQPPEGFWLDIVDAVRGVAQRFEALMQLYAPRLNRIATGAAEGSPHRSASRYPTSMPVLIDNQGRVLASEARNISTSGLYVHTRAEVAVGSLIGLRLAVPDGEPPVHVHARIIHRVAPGEAQSPWSEPGIGLQFVEGDDAFRRRLDAHVERLKSVAAPLRGRG